MLKQSYFLLALLAGFALITELLVHAQNYDQSSFISIDCGIPRNANYTEPSTKLNYISDADFIARGTAHSIAGEYRDGIQEQSKTVRSFPEGTRNCYKVRVTARTRHLIRATFTHGNYDGKNTAPEFDLYIGGNVWDTVTIRDLSIPEVKEIIHIPTRNHTLVCLVNTGFGTPFISALEFRPMSEQVHYNNTGPFESLALLYRMDAGSNSPFAYRYPRDIIDRIWIPFPFLSYWTQFNTTETVDVNSNVTYRAPSIVTSTVSSPINESQVPLFIFWDAPDTRTKYYFYLHIAELQQLKANESREFTITVNEDDQTLITFSPIYLKTTILYNPGGSSGAMNYSIWFAKTDNSTLPPIVNAYEIFSALDVSQSETDEDDVDGISSIKSSYGINKRNWDGDPCVPRQYLWTGLNCSYDSGDETPRIISLNLSSSGLNGEISTHLSKLSMIESLDLSNNNLSGSVPDFLSRLSNLRVLNLEGNNLSGSIPDELIEKVNDGLLSLSIGENVNLCTLPECNESNKKNNILIPILSSVGGVVVLLLLAMAILVALKKKRKESKPHKNEPFEATKRRYSYAEVLKITKNFERVLGKGGFGEVFHGFIDERTQVAVKMLSSSSGQGYQQFQAEVNLLMKVYHGNLTSLVGYCYEESHMALIYEYMANGDLSTHLSGNRSNNSMLSWEGRLQIAIDAALGLEYLHNGCKPPIIHRDIKTANILLTENFRAKIADFGLSKSFTADNVTHVSTSVAGTHGYLDPKYRETGWLNEKSDVYSFGVVLLEIITSRSPRITIRSDPIEKIHISQWVRSVISSGVITNVVDPRLRGDFDTNSVWKAIEVGMACASESLMRRPNMSQVVSELKECLALEIARKNSYSRTVTDSTTDSYELSSTVTSEFLPSAR